MADGSSADTVAPSGTAATPDLKQLIKESLAEVLRESPELLGSHHGRGSETGKFENLLSVA